MKSEGANTMIGLVLLFLSNDRGLMKEFVFNLGKDIALIGIF
jgi:hypothetical protein